jgi:hypothetical protein
VIEDHHRFAIPLRRPAVEEREGLRHVRGGIERTGRTIVQTLERFGQGPLEGANGAFRSPSALGFVPGRAPRGSWDCWSSDPNRDEKEGDRRQREDCASSQAPASYIQTTD